MQNKELFNSLVIPVRNIFLIVMIMFFSFSCNTEKSKLIPVKELVPLLTDLYIADGLLKNPVIRPLFLTKDSTSNYIDIINKHGYTKERMDNTMRYYFAHDPKKLEKIYDQALARLSEAKARLEEEEAKPLPVTTINLWNAKTSYAVPETGIDNPVWFDIPVKDTGNYELQLTAIVYKDDQSLNPKINVYFWRPDTSAAGLRDYWNPVYLPKDEVKHSFTLSKRLTDTTFTNLRGWLLGHDTQSGRWVKHAAVENIVIQITGVK